MRKGRRRNALSAVACAVLPLTVCHTTRAQTSGSWIVDADGSWSIGSNWTSSPLFPGLGGVATLGAFPSLSAQRTITLDLPSVTLNGLTFDSEIRYLIGPPSGNTITLAGPASLNVLASNPSSPSVLALGHVIGVPIGGSSGLHKSGPGPVQLSATGTYTGGTTIAGGVLASSVGDGAFGTGSIAISNASIRAITAAMSSARDFVVTGSATFETFADITTTGVVSGGGSVTKTQATGILGLAASNSYTGSTTIRAGTLVLLGNGSIRNSPAILNSASIVLDNGGVNLNDRIGDSATIAFQGGGITFTGNNASDTLENYGNTSLDGGMSFYTAAPNGARNLSIMSAGITRSNGGALYVRGSNLGATPGASVANLYFASPPALVGGGGAAGSTSISVIPWAWGSLTNNASSNDPANGLVTYGANGVRVLNNTTEYVTNLSSGATTNARITASTAVPGAQTVNALVLGSGGGLTGSGTLTIASGALLHMASSATIAPAISFGSAEGVLMENSLLTINGKISGSGGLTKTGLGGATLTSLTSDYTGVTTITAGNITVTRDITAGSPGPLGSDSSAIVLAPGGAFAATARLWVAGAPTVTISRNLIATGNPSGAPGLGTAVSGPSLVMNGDIDIQTQLSLEGDTGRTMFLNGTISGPGRLTDNFASGNVINGNNTYSGGTELRDGSYALGSNTALGTGTIWFTVSGGAISADAAARSIANPVVVFAGPSFTGSQDLTLTGPIDLAGLTLTHTISNTSITTYAGSVFGGGFVKSGTGTLVLTGTNSFTGFVTVGSGALRIASSSALGSAENRTTVAAAAALELQGGAVSGEPVSIGGTGIASAGAIRNLSGSNSLGPVILTANSSIAVDSGALTTGPVTGSPNQLTKLGTGTLSAANFRVGTLNLATGAARVTPGRSVSATSVVTSISIAGGAMLDLGDNDLVIDWTTADPLATIQAYLTSGYNSGAWTGSGINSSSAAASAGTTPKLALGFAAAPDLFTSFPATFSGQSVDATSILIRYTAYGDANLDGTVDTIDFNAVASNFSSTGQNWVRGDFNFDTTIDTTDFNLLASNFGVILPAAEIPALTVPEPGVLAIPAGWLALAGPRRRRAKKPRG